jgi:hypothetical protein
MIVCECVSFCSLSFPPCVCLCGFCNVWVRVCVCFVMCGCFGNVCTCIYCVFILFYLCIFIILTCQRLIFRFTGATREKLSEMSGVRLRHRSLWQRVTYITKWPPLLATHIRVPFGKSCERCQEYGCVISHYSNVMKVTY